VRTAIAAVAVAGTLVAAFGVLFAVTWMILTGVACLVFAVAVGALTGAVLHRREQGRR
jgi:hypothetical protein